MTHKLFAQLEVDLGRARDAMARLVERAHSADPELLAGLVTTCRYCGLLDASVAAHARASASSRRSAPACRTPGSCRRDHGRVAAIKLAEYPYIVPLVAGGARARRRGAAALREIEQKTPTRIRDFIIAARTLLEATTPRASRR